MELSVEESCTYNTTQQPIIAFVGPQEQCAVHTGNCRFNKLQIAGHLVSAQLCFENGEVEEKISRQKGKPHVVADEPSE